MFTSGLMRCEGALDVTHSIPLLGWYGNWTEPSSFDTGSYLDYAYGALQQPQPHRCFCEKRDDLVSQGLRKGPVLHRQHLWLL